MSLCAAKPGVETIDCQYPLIHRSNHESWHFLHAFTKNQRLGLSVKPAAFKGEIHISALEIVDVASAGDYGLGRAVLDRQGRR